MGRSSGMKNWLLVFAVGCLLTFASSESANADGCWGSSRGGWGSGGSLGGGFGSRGGLLSNAPVRNLLSRVGVGVGNGISLVGDGIATIFERRPLQTALSGCRGGGSGGWGSNGGFGSTGRLGGLGSNGGGGWGSTGSGSWANSGSGWGSTGSYASAATVAPSYAAAPIQSYDSGSSILDLPIVAPDSFDSFSNYDSFSNFSNYDSFTNYDGFANYDNFNSVSAYVDPIVSPGIPTTQFETSAPILDYGFYGTQLGTVGIPTDAAFIDNSIITGPMLEVQGESSNGINISPGIDDLPGLDGGSEPTLADPPFGAQEDDDDVSTYIIRGEAILSLDVPKDAKVYINDKLTQTQGTRRSYVSKNLIRGNEYRYRVKVVSETNGKEVVKSRDVKMRGGESNQLAFNFDPIVTRVVVSVPDDAKVIIDGKETATTGAYRSFSTRKLKSGKWDDYSVEVSVVRNGKTLTRKEKFDLAAGEFRFFEFDFDNAGSGSVASK